MVLTLSSVARWEVQMPCSLLCCRYYSFSFLGYVLNCFCRVQLCNPMDCSLPGSSVHGILQARILKWVAISFSRGFSWPRDQTQVSCIPCIGRQVLSTSATWEPSLMYRAGVKWAWWGEGPGQSQNIVRSCTRLKVVLGEAHTRSWSGSKQAAVNKRWKLRWKSFSHLTGPFWVQCARHGTEDSNETTTVRKIIK